MTWAFGHFRAVQACHARMATACADLSVTPRIIPGHYSRSSPVRSVRRKVTSPTAAWVSQIKVIKRLFDTSEHISSWHRCRTRGELSFRYLPSYGLHHLFVRLWISSLTDKVSARDCGKLEDGSKYGQPLPRHKRRANPTGSWASTAQALFIAAVKIFPDLPQTCGNLSCHWVSMKNWHVFGLL